MQIGLTVPHCSTKLPKEVREQMRPRINGYYLDTLMFLQSDVGSDLLYGSSQPTLSANYSRFVVDLNRSKEDSSQNGIVALADYDGNWLHRCGHIPNNGEIERRIAEYWEPYHSELEEMAENIDLLIDCHTMGGEVTERCVGSRGPRPDICIANGGNGTDTCKDEIFGYLVRQLEETFPELDVKTNNPFSGGYIVKNCETDAVMLEFNTDLFFQRNEHLVSYSKANEINQRMQEFFDAVSRM